MIGKGDEAMDVLAKLQRMLDERGWTMYRLGKESGLSEKTVSNIYRRGTMPSIPTLESICKAFGITMSEFFSETDTLDLNPDLKEVFQKWPSLTQEQKEATLTMIRAFQRDRS